MSQNGRDYFPKHEGGEPVGAADGGWIRPVGAYDAWKNDAGPGEPARESGSLVRPYTRTGGRTRSDVDLAIESLVVTSEKGRSPDASLGPEHWSICGLCRETRSVAEIAAHLRLPLGVTKVLVGDLAGMGLVVIHQNELAEDQPSADIMERVLSGLRRL